MKSERYIENILNLCQLQTCWLYSFLFIALKISHTNVLFRGPVRGCKGGPLSLGAHTHNHTQTRNTHVWDKAIGSSDGSIQHERPAASGSRWFQVVLCWPWQDAAMQAGVTRLLMCYHGNGRKENRRAIGHVCVCVWVHERLIFAHLHFFFFYMRLNSNLTPVNKLSKERGDLPVHLFFLVVVVVVRA